MRYWVTLDENRIMEGTDEDDLLEGSFLETAYHIRELRALVEYGDSFIAADEEDILHGEQKVKITDNMGRSVFVPCIVREPIEEK